MKLKILMRKPKLHKRLIEEILQTKDVLYKKSKGRIRPPILDTSLD